MRSTALSRSFSVTNHPGLHSFERNRMTTRTTASSELPAYLPCNALSAEEIQAISSFSCPPKEPLSGAW
jgi:hypothetical protein